MSLPGAWVVVSRGRAPAPQLLVLVPRRHAVRLQVVIVVHSVAQPSVIVERLVVAAVEAVVVVVVVVVVVRSS